MMTNKVTIVFFLSFFTCTKLIAQGSSPFYYGKVITSDEGTKEIRYKRFSNSIDNSTKYSIDLDGVEIFEVNFKYLVNEKINKADSLRVDFYDKQTAKSIRRYLKFEPCYSHVIIQDYEANAEKIDEINTHSILFSIDRFVNNRIDSPFVTLYRFQGIAGETFVLEQSIPSLVLSKHYDAVNDWKVCKSAGQRDSLLIVKMFQLKETTLNSIKAEIDFLTDQKSPVLADGKMQDVFEEQMNKLIPFYYNNVFAPIDDSFTVHFKFICNGHGRIDSTTMNFINRTDKKNWFKDSFMTHLKPEIEKRWFRPGTDIFSKPSLKYDFGRRINLDSLQELSTFSTKFQEPIQEIYSAFEPYISVEIHTPVIYTYAIKYASKKDQVSWKFLGFDENHEPKIKMQDPSKLSDFTEEDLKVWIKNQSTLPPKKNESDVTIVYINGKKTSIDIKATSK